MDAASIADWSNYLVAQAGAAAALTGLIFVAVSINLSPILSIPGLTGRAAESMMQLFGVLVISTSALIPRQPMAALGTEVLVAGSLLWLVQTTLQVRYARRKTGHPRFWVVTRVVQTQFLLCSLPDLGDPAAARVVSGILLAGAGPYSLALRRGCERLGAVDRDLAVITPAAWRRRRACAFLR